MQLPAHEKKQEVLISQQKHSDLVRRLKAEGFSDPAMLNWTFETDNGRSPQMHHAHRYVEQWQTMRTADMLVNTYAHIQQSSRVELGKKFEEGFYAKQESPSPQAVPAAGEPTISMTALLELPKNAGPDFSGLRNKKERQILRFDVQYLVHLAHSYPNFSPLSQLPQKQPFPYLPYN